MSIWTAARKLLALDLDLVGFVKKKSITEKMAREMSFTKEV